MEIKMVPSQFLSVVLEEDNVSASEEDSHFSHILNWQNRNSTKSNDTAVDQEMWDLTKHLPKALLAECTVEISRTPISQNEKVKKPCFDANVSPVFRNSKFTSSPQRANVSVQQYLPPPPQLLHRSEWMEERMDVQDLLTGVEAVYSDNESGEEYEEAASVSIFPITVNKTDKTKPDKPKKQDLSKFSYPCEHCPNVYSNRGALWQHSVATHSVEKTCECKICGRKFYRNCSLALHLKSHSEEEYCQCKECGKSFNRLANLERHMKVHAEAEQYPCPSCDKVFRDKANLLRHAAVHTTARAFQCEVCFKHYKSQDHLDVHYQTAHAQSETSLGCSTCGDVFTNFAELMQHAATHSAEKELTDKTTSKKQITHGGERLRCMTCGLDFTQKSSLLRHVKRMHPQESDIIDSSLLDDKNSGSSETGSLQDTEQEDEIENESHSTVEIRKVLGSPVKSHRFSVNEQHAMTNNEKTVSENNKSKLKISEISLSPLLANGKEEKCIQAESVNKCSNGKDKMISEKECHVNKNETDFELNSFSEGIVNGKTQEADTTANNDEVTDPKLQHFKTDIVDPLTSVDINTMHSSSVKLET